MNIRALTFPMFAIAIGTALGLGLAELTLRIAGPEWLEHRMRFLHSGANSDLFEASDAGWQVERVNDRFTRFVPDASWNEATPEYSYGVRIDHFGGRRTCVDVEDGRKPALVFLGDSFTFGVGVDDCSTFASLLALRMSSTRAVNLGIPGSALAQQLWVVEQRQREFDEHSAYVFFFFLGNDFSDLVGTRPFWWEAPRPGESAVPIAERSEFSRSIEYANALTHKYRILRNSYLAQFLRRAAMRIYQANHQTAVEGVFQVMDSRNEAFLSLARDAIAVSLARLKQFAIRSGAQKRIVIVAVPDRYQVLPQLRARQMAYYGMTDAEISVWRPNEMLRAAAASAGITLIDGSECVMTTAATRGGLYYENDNHLTKAGHAAFAACVGDALSALLQAD